MAAAGQRSICLRQKKRTRTCTVFLAHMAHVAHGRVRTMYSLNAESTVHSLPPLKTIFIKVRSLSLALVEDGNDDSAFYNASGLRRKYCV